ncbi:MAG: hypothetical protein HY914_19405 [Desulfomonile tiedjei]|nr:hypothetical protein [Desulfomonile tiedjei]
MRIRKLRIFTVFFVILVILAAYGLALLRTYVFKPPQPAASSWCFPGVPEQASTRVGHDRAVA